MASGPDNLGDLPDWLDLDDLASLEPPEPRQTSRFGLSQLIVIVGGMSLAAVAVFVLVSLLGRSAPSEDPGLRAPHRASPSLSSAVPSVVPSTSNTSASPPVITTASALVKLSSLKVKERDYSTDYDRARFGQAWLDVDRNGCDTRNDVLRRDLKDVKLKPDSNGCAVLTGRLKDPYTGRTIDFIRGEGTSLAVQVDHVVPLSDAWHKGARQWSTEKLERFANDPLELLAVDGFENQAKSDGDAATWLPPNSPYRCEYVALQIAIKAKYELWLTAAERATMARILARCPNQQLPRSKPIRLG